MEGALIQYTGQKTVLRNTPDKISEVSPGCILLRNYETILTGETTV